MSEQELQTPSNEVEEPETGEETIDAEALERRRQALEQVVQFGDPILRSKATPVSEFDENLREEVERMIQLMQAAMGVGLAATQVGQLRRLLVFQAGPDSPPRAIVNPQIEWASPDAEVAEEGCLSIPGIREDVQRQPRIVLEYLDEAFKPHRETFEGYAARVLQHEHDHLDGILFTELLPPLRKRMLKGKLRDISMGKTDAKYKMRFTPVK